MIRRALLTLFVVILPFAHAFAASNDELAQLNQLYKTFLTDHVSSGSKNGLPANMVNYGAVKKDPRLGTLMEMLEAYPKEQLVTQADKIAFYLNAYNILAINKVADHWPIFKLKSLGNFIKPVWTHPAGEVCGEKMTLRILEHDILRKLGDPRIHFALNCASMSCPDLRAEPYTADRLENQLEEQTKIFLSQEGKGFKVIGENKVKLSPIFDWFIEDFDTVGGVEAYVNPYLPPSEKAWEIVGYLDYNWDVNCILNAKDKMTLRKKRNTWFD